MNTSTALVILDGQNDFLSEGGVLHEAIRAKEGEPSLLEKLNTLIARARDCGMTIINTRITFSEGYPEAGEDPYGIFAAVKETGGFIEGSWGAETAEGLDVQPDDLVFEKHGMSAFLNPEFEAQLKQRGITKLILAGLLTDACVECTMRAAYDKGYEVLAVDEAIAALDPSKHRSTVDNSFPLFSKATSTEELAAACGQ